MNNWTEILREEAREPYFKQLTKLVREDSKESTVYPARKDIFNAFKLSSYQNTRVVILGQDPYHGPGQAHGLSFSVQKGVDIPPSLRNIHKELKTDLGIESPGHGSLVGWAKQGVLLLNTYLTVRQGEPGSHKNYGWDTFTNRMIRILNKKEERVVFILWGAAARKHKILIHNQSVVESAHPSPLSAYNGFFGSKPFSKTNQILEMNQADPIDWSIFE